MLPFAVFQVMSPKEKTKFEEMAKQDKARYDQEMMSYNPGKRGRKAKKDPSAPRRPPYVLLVSLGQQSYLTKGPFEYLSIQILWHYTI